METLSLRIESLSKSYPPRKKGGATTYAVENLSFSIQQGEVVAFLGPNGAGKSTTIKMLCGILSPTSGHSEILGYPSGSKQANGLLGLVFGTRSQLFMHMTVGQSLDLLGDIYFVPEEIRKKRIQELAETFEVDIFINSRARTLSLGERMRCEIVAALIHRPRILLLDEPTIGLDIVAKNRLRELIRAWQKSERTTLLLTSHDISDVEALCERCILIDNGKKQFDGTLSALKGDLASLRRLEITLHSSDVQPVGNESTVKFLKDENMFIHKYEFQINEISVPNAISSLSRHYGEALADVRLTEVTLEEVLKNRFLQKGGAK